MATIVRTKGKCCDKQSIKTSTDQFSTKFCENCYSVISYEKNDNSIAKTVKAVREKKGNDIISYGYVEKHTLYEILEKKHKHHFVPKIDSAFALIKKGVPAGCITTEDDKNIIKLIVKTPDKFSSSVINRFYLEKQEWPKAQGFIQKFLESVKENNILVMLLDDIDVNEIKAIKDEFLYIGKYKDFKKGKVASPMDKKNVFVKLVGIDQKKLLIDTLEYVITEKQTETANQISLF